VSLFQCLVLLLFNTCDEMSVEEIKSSTAIEVCHILVFIVGTYLHACTCTYLFIGVLKPKNDLRLNEKLTG